MASSIVLRLSRLFTFECRRVSHARVSGGFSLRYKVHWNGQVRSSSHRALRSKNGYRQFLNPKYQQNGVLSLQSCDFSTAGEKNHEASSNHDPWPELCEKSIGKTRGEQNSKLLQQPDQPPDARVLRVAIIGTPNSGKSTLTNQLMGWRVSSVSKKVHTTRRTTMAVLTEGNTQLIFLDTPGLMHPREKRRHKLDRVIMTDPGNSLENADIVGVIVDTSHKFTRNQLDPVVLQALHLHSNKPSFLILNKTDAVKTKASLLGVTQRLTEGMVGGAPNPVLSKKKKKTSLDLQELIDRTPPILVASPDSASADDNTIQSPGISAISTQPALARTGEEGGRGEMGRGERGRGEMGRQDPKEVNTWTDFHERLSQAGRAAAHKTGWPHFQQVFMISALTGEGVADMKEFLLSSAGPGDWEFHSSLVTDQDPCSLALLCVWEKLLELLPQEVPYSLFPEIALWEEDEDGILNIVMDIPTSNRRHFKFILGRGGSTIKTISVEAKQEIMNAFRCEVRLKLQAKLLTKT